MGTQCIVKFDILCTLQIAVLREDNCPRLFQTLGLSWSLCDKHRLLSLSSPGSVQLKYKKFSKFCLISQSVCSFRSFLYLSHSTERFLLLVFRITIVPFLAHEKKTNACTVGNLILKYSLSLKPLLDRWLILLV